MMSAHRLNVDQRVMFDLLLDDRGRRLAAQFAVGPKGHPYRVAVRVKHLERHWAETGEIVASSQVWPEGFVATWADYLDTHQPILGMLPPTEAAVMGVAFRQVKRLQHTRPAIPVRLVEAETGLRISTASDVLRRLARNGFWLAPHTRGTHSAVGSTGKASCYVVAPWLLELYVLGLNAPPTAQEAVRKALEAPQAPARPKGSRRLEAVR
jgi:hypothetical protein